MSKNPKKSTVIPPESGPRRIRRFKAQSGAGRVGWKAQAFLAICAMVWMVPVVMVIGTSLMPANNPKMALFGMFAETPTLANYVQVITENPILTHGLNSVLITAPTVFLVVALGSMVAFAFAKLKVPFKRLLLAAFILALVLPISGIVVAVYKILQGIGLYNNLLGLILVYTSLGLPFAIIVLRTSFLAIPHDTFEAARLDGASHWTILWRVYLPLAKPAVSVVVIWQIMMTWNDFLLPLISINSDSLKPLTLVPLSYQGTYLSQPGALFAVLVLISVPVVIVFIVLQKQLVNGLAGSIK